MSVHILSALDLRPASPVYPLPAGLIVSRIQSDTVYQACALCWVGPYQLAGEVRERRDPTAPPKPICSRCLVTLEMLAIQFGPELRLQVDTLA